jgi:mRNA-degrading endonuclease RelE of RelBE toxin-antitoxin system
VAGVLRRRIGDYRIHFTADRAKQKVFVLRILLVPKRRIAEKLRWSFATRATRATVPV